MRARSLMNRDAHHPPLRPDRGPPRPLPTGACTWGNARTFSIAAGTRASRAGGLFLFFYRIDLTSPPSPVPSTRPAPSALYDSSGPIRLGLRPFVESIERKGTYTASLELI